MSVFDLKGSSGGNGWNYAHPDKPGYMEMIEGTVVEISAPQKRNFQSGKPEFWPDGNPVLNLCLVIKGRSGNELSWIFAPKSKAADACSLALDPTRTREQVSIEEMLGKFVRIQTQAGVYNAQNPRPWTVTVLGDGDAGSVRSVVKPQQSAQQQPMPQQQPAPQPQPAPQQQPVPQIQYAQQQAAQALGYQQAPAPQPQQPMQQQAPANQVPYADDPTGGYYDQDIPF